MAKRAEEHNSYGQQFGLLEVLTYLIALAVVVGSIMRGWDLNLLIALIILAVVYAVFRDIKALIGLSSTSEQAKPSETTRCRQSAVRDSRPPASTGPAPATRKNDVPGLRRMDASHPIQCAERNEA